MRVLGKLPSSARSKPPKSPPLPAPKRLTVICSRFREGSLLGCRRRDELCWCIGECAAHEASCVVTSAWISGMSVSSMSGKFRLDMRAVFFLGGVAHGVSRTLSATLGSHDRHSYFTLVRAVNRRLPATANAHVKTAHAKGFLHAARKVDRTLEDISQPSEPDRPSLNS